MPTELLTASEAARRLGIPTRALVRLISERQIRYVMVEWHRPRPRGRA